MNEFTDAFYNEWVYGQWIYAECAASVKFDILTAGLGSLKCTSVQNFSVPELIIKL